MRTVLQTMLVLASSLVLLGCDGGVDLVGGAIEGYESFGAEGGNMLTPDGGLQVEVEAGALPREVDISVGRLDDCFPGALACYELEPAGLEFRKAAQVTLDLAGVELLARAEPLTVYVLDHEGWHAAASLQPNDDTVSLPLQTLGPVAVAAAPM